MTFKIGQQVVINPELSRKTMESMPDAGREAWRYQIIGTVQEMDVDRQTATVYFERYGTFEISQKSLVDLNEQVAKALHLNSHVKIGDRIAINPAAVAGDMGMDSTALQTVQRLGAVGEVIELNDDRSAMVQFKSHGTFHINTFVLRTITAPTSLRRLWDSTMALYDRFSLTRYTTPPPQRRKVLMEEVGELIEASALLERDSSSVRIRLFTEELADVLVTALGLAQAHGVEMEDIERACEAVAEKNDAKTTNTHHLINGKITRKSASMPRVSAPVLESTIPVGFYITDASGTRMRDGNDEEFVVASEDEARGVIGYYFETGYGDKFIIVNKETRAKMVVEREADGDE